jgi:hypothetical protein
VFENWDNYDLEVFKSFRQILLMVQSVWLQLAVPSFVLRLAGLASKLVLFLDQSIDYSNYDATTNKYKQTHTNSMGDENRRNR